MWRRLMVPALLLALVAGCAGGGQPDPQVAALIAELRADDLGLRTRAAIKLQQIGPAARDAVPALVENLGTGRSAKRQALNVAATNALLRIGPGATVPALIEALRGGDPEIAYGAAFTLGGFGAAARPAVPALLAALEVPAVRPAAHTALQMIGEES